MFDTSNYLKHYDISLEKHVTMYDNLPYKRNYDMCNENTVRYYSGNITKYYLIPPNDNVAIINNHDEDIYAILEKAATVPEQASIPAQIVEDESYISDGITSEQMEHLLSDSSSEDPVYEKPKEPIAPEMDFSDIEF